MEKPNFKKVLKIIRFSLLFVVLFVFAIVRTPFVSKDESKLSKDQKFPFPLANADTSAVSSDANGDDDGC